jgi:aspartyl-tRNA(Asn)/glutamyl-tRNA(Gln) amidotransferase subunit A
MTNSKSSQIYQWDLATLAKSIREKEVSPVETAAALLKRIEKVDKKLNAFITVLHDEVMTSAKQSEQEVMDGKIRGPLHGVPVGLKDIVYTKGIRTTMGSESFKNHLPGYDAAVVEKLKGAGALIIGKLNTHQFAYGPTGDRSYYGPSRNPYDTNRITGGSSGGSGAAVAAGLCYGALGTDTGGSVRIPSACCGIVGMKPTFGRVSKYGVFPLSWTLDHVGPMTRTVRDNAIMLSVMSGHDPRDPYSIQRDPEDFTRHLHEDIKGSVIGIPTGFYFENVDEEILASMREVISLFKSLGAQIKEVAIPYIYEAWQAHQVVLRSEAFAIHKERVASEPDKYDDLVKERILTGQDTKAYEYVDAEQLRIKSVQGFHKVLQEVDVILAPTLAILPTEVFQTEITRYGERRLVRGEITRLTGPTDLNGLPSLTVPCGFSPQGLPIGFQLIGGRLNEAKVYQFGHAFETACQIPTLKTDIV